MRKMDLYPMIPIDCSYRFMQRDLFKQRGAFVVTVGLELTYLIVDLGWLHGFNSA